MFTNMNNFGKDNSANDPPDLSLEMAKLIHPNYPVLDNISIQDILISSKVNEIWSFKCL